MFPYVTHFIYPGKDFTSTGRWQAELLIVMQLTSKVDLASLPWVVGFDEWGDYLATCCARRKTDALKRELQPLLIEINTWFDPYDEFHYRTQEDIVESVEALGFCIENANLVTGGTYLIEHALKVI